MNLPDDHQLPRGVTPFDLSGPLTVHFDGSCQPPGSGGVAGWGFVIEGSGFHIEDCGLATAPHSPHSTNNVAEYSGAIRALEQLRSIGYSGEVLVEGDSQLVIRQMTGEYEVRAQHLKAYHEWLAQLSQSFRNIEFRWVPREENTVADALSKRAITEASDDARRAVAARRRSLAPADSKIGPP